MRNRRMRARMYGGVRGRKTKVGGKPTFVFLLLDYTHPYSSLSSSLSIPVHLYPYPHTDF